MSSGTPPGPRHEVGRRRILFSTQKQESVLEKEIWHGKTNAIAQNYRVPLINRILDFSAGLIHIFPYPTFSSEYTELGWRKDTWFQSTVDIFLIFFSNICLFKK